MNTHAMLRGEQVHANPGCGHMALKMRERVLWQSKLGLRNAPLLVDIVALAKEIRRAYARGDK